MLRIRAPEACEGVRGSFSYERAVRAQKELSTRVVLRPPPELAARVVIAVDAAYWGPREIYGVAVAIAMEWERGVVGCKEAVGPVCVPYVPGLLAFREASLMGPAVRALRPYLANGLLLVDGHGIAHPRRFGIASHLGVTLSMPSIGVAKRLLYGRVEDCSLGRCIVAGGDVIGVELDSSGRPIYVSPGNMVDVASAAFLVKSMLRPGVLLPLPLQIADAITKFERRRLAGTSPTTLDVKDCEGEVIELAQEVIRKKEEGHAAASGP